MIPSRPHCMMTKQQTLTKIIELLRVVNEMPEDIHIFSIDIPPANDVCGIYLGDSEYDMRILGGPQVIAQSTVNPNRVDLESEYTTGAGLCVGVRAIVHKDACTTETKEALSIASQPTGA